MKNTDIAKIRQLLINAKETLEFSVTHKSDGQVLCLEKLKEALALLPCPTCNGTGKKMANDHWGMIHKELPCPDCRS